MTINGITIKTPTDLKVSVFRLTKSERTASGTMMMDIIAVKRRLDLSWAIISDTDLQTILNTLESRVFHTVIYPDPQGGDSKTITAYVGEINAQAWQKVGNRYWKDVSIALVEQ